MEAIQTFLSREFYNNAVQDYAIAVLILVGLSFVLMVVKQVALAVFKKLAHKTATDFDDILVKLLSKIGAPTFAVISLYLATYWLELEANVRALLNYALVTILTVRVVLLLQDLT